MLNSGGKKITSFLFVKFHSKSNNLIDVYLYRSSIILCKYKEVKHIIGVGVLLSFFFLLHMMSCGTAASLECADTGKGRKLLTHRISACILNLIIWFYGAAHR